MTESRDSRDTRDILTRAGAALEQILVGAETGAHTPEGYPSFRGKTASDVRRADRI